MASFLATLLLFLAEGEGIRTVSGSEKRSTDSREVLSLGEPTSSLRSDVLSTMSFMEIFILEVTGVSGIWELWVLANLLTKSSVCTADRKEFEKKR